MSFIKSTVRWVKEKWFIPLSAFVVIVLSVLLKTKNKSLFEFMKKDFQLAKNTEKDLRNLEHKAKKEQEKIEQQTENKINKLKIKRQKKLNKISEDKKLLIDELSKKTNKELAEMLRKGSDEI